MLGEKQTVKQAIESGVRFDRVVFVDKKQMAGPLELPLADRVIFVLSSYGVRQLLSRDTSL